MYEYFLYGGFERDAFGCHSFYFWLLVFRVEDLTTEKAKWERFREDCDRVEKELRDELKFHEKNPEKHPKYPEEWKLFWNRRYKVSEFRKKEIFFGSCSNPYPFIPP